MGNKFKIIHTLNREFSEIISGVNDWLPLYIIGDIKPYYYPKLRDSLYQRSLFIAEDLCAISSISVRSKTNDMANFYITNTNAIQALIKEFNNYLDVSKELFKIYKKDDLKKINTIYVKMLNSYGDSVYQHPLPSLFALPDDVLDSIISKTKNKEFLDIINLEKKMFYSIITKYKITVYIRDHEDVLNKIDEVDRITLPILDYLYSEKIFYSKDDYIKHYNNLKALGNKYKNLEIIESKGIPYDISFYCKSDIAIIAKHNVDNLVFSITENIMINAIKEFIMNKSKNFKS